MLQALNRKDHNLRLHFCVHFQQWLEERGFAEKLVFTDEATFHVCGKVNRHIVHILGTENPYATAEHVRDSPKVNVFCSVSSCKVCGPLLFFFLGGGVAEPTVTGINYLDVLRLWLIPQLQEDSEDFILTHLLTSMLIFPVVGLGALLTMTPLLTWPPRSPDLTHCDFFLWGYMNDRVLRAPYAT
jgi:hypothetical protein